MLNLNRKLRNGYIIYDALRNSIPLVQFQNHEKYAEVLILVKLQAKVYELKPATLLKVTLLHGCSSWLLNCANGTKLRKASHITFFSLELDISLTSNLPKFN